jgi:hypothetical protein
MSQSKHPGEFLATQENPLTEHLPPYMDPAQLAAALRNEPLRQPGFNLASGFERRIELELRDQHYWPTSVLQEVADSIQIMVRHGLNRRNPLNKVEQVRINTLAFDKNVDPESNQSLRCEVSGSVVSGITGVGKSATIRRMLSVMGPQVVVHTRSEVAGWSRLVQVTYLFIDFPAQPTRGGLYAAILGELDRLLGTSYVNELRRQRDLEAKSALVTRLLSIHRVGLLVVDENQQSTLDAATWGDVFVNYFIRLMNIGIPVLLSGNPMAFTNLAASAQLARRFAKAGWYDLGPAQSADVAWWSSEYVPGAMRFSVFKEVPQVDEVCDATFGGCAGVPAFFMEWWVEAQARVLKRNPASNRLTIADIIDASKSPRIKPLLKIAEAISSGNVAAHYGDLPRSPSPERADSGRGGKRAGVNRRSAEYEKEARVQRKLELRRSRASEEIMQQMVEQAVSSKCTPGGKR